MMIHFAQQLNSVGCSPFWRFSCLWNSIGPCPLWKILTNIGVPEKMLSMFRKLYSNVEGCVRVAEKDSHWFTALTAEWGSTALRRLIAYLNGGVDHLMTKVFHRIPRVCFGNLQLSDTEYADDTGLRSVPALTSDGTLWKFTQKETSKLGLKDSWRKIQLMHAGDGSDPSGSWNGRGVVCVTFCMFGLNCH